jgi:hypothetical protein
MRTVRIMVTPLGLRPDSARPRGLVTMRTVRTCGNRVDSRSLPKEWCRLCPDGAHPWGPRTMSPVDKSFARVNSCSLPKE